MRIIRRADIALHGACAAGWRARRPVRGAVRAPGRGPPRLLGVPRLCRGRAAPPVQAGPAGAGGIPAAWREILRREVRYYRGLDAPGRAPVSSATCAGFSTSGRSRAWTACASPTSCGCSSRRGRRSSSTGGPTGAAARTCDPALPARVRRRVRVRAARPLDGQAHGQGPVILARGAVREGWRDPAGASNVVLHEFAHLLDMKGGVSRRRAPGNAAGGGARLAAPRRGGDG